MKLYILVGGQYLLRKLLPLASRWKVNFYSDMEQKFSPKRPCFCHMHVPTSNPRCCWRCELWWVGWVNVRSAGLLKQWIPSPGPNGCSRANMLSGKHDISWIKNKLLLNYQNLLQYEGLNDTVTKVYSLVAGGYELMSVLGSADSLEGKTPSSQHQIQWSTHCKCGQITFFLLPVFCIL